MHANQSTVDHPAKLIPAAANRYAVLDRKSITLPLLFIRSYLANATATQRGDTCKRDAECEKPSVCMVGRCIESYTRLHESYGTGLEFDSSRGYFVVADPSKPTWVESNWDVPGLRMFKKTSTTAQAVELVVGILFTLVAIAATYFGRRFVGKTLKVA
ncbi:hypothetical protein SYNPS1DRAFT_31036 [Syncephalis pseudoplumigaleata]|uniref:Nicastrin n=1 Tax=Syncephalis pseudoplumigaleata TaxID=1712513 RepID=A0A4P9YWD5_9FUNG|nr:hypothetical protein SYNPS1DRAFT_31036 [Syncephalis pseudoplumigaleata]|eukprot:RKP23250.1 hypothetical protein SYNPS1DRAFT_31036 [Syncephalis pseudoplumigaleata]